MQDTNPYAPPESIEAPGAAQPKEQLLRAFAISTLGTIAGTFCIYLIFFWPHIDHQGHQTVQELIQLKVATLFFGAMLGSYPAIPASICTLIAPDRHRITAAIISVVFWTTMAGVGLYKISTSS